MAATTVHSTTYKWVRELPIPCKYVQERGGTTDLGLGFGLACAIIEMFVLKLQPMIYGSTVAA